MDFTTVEANTAGAFALDDVSTSISFEQTSVHSTVIARDAVASMISTQLPTYATKMPANATLVTGMIENSTSN